MGKPLCSKNEKWQRNDHICQSCYWWWMKLESCQRPYECEREKRRKGK